MFNVGSHRQQIVLSGSLQADALQAYQAARAANPSANFVMHTVLIKLDDLLAVSIIQVDIYQGLPDGYGYDS